MTTAALDEWCLCGSTAGGAGSTRSGSWAWSETAQETTASWCGAGASVSGRLGVVSHFDFGLGFVLMCLVGFDDVKRR